MKCHLNRGYNYNLVQISLTACHRTSRQMSPLTDVRPSTTHFTYILFLARLYRGGSVWISDTILALLKFCAAVFALSVQTN